MINSRDDLGNDFVSCGPNQDTAFVDPVDKVNTPPTGDCENVDDTS